MSLLSMAVAFTLNDPTVWMLAAGLGGLLTGQVMNSKGLSVLQDIFSGGVGARAGVSIAGPHPAYGASRHGRARHQLPRHGGHRLHRPLA